MLQLFSDLAWIKNAVQAKNGKRCGYRFNFLPKKGRIQLEQSNDDLKASAFWKTEDTDCFLHHRIMAAGWCSDAGRGCLMIPNCLHCMACVSPLYQHSVYLIFILIHIFVPPCIFMYPYGYCTCFILMFPMQATRENYRMNPNVFLVEE